MRYFLISLILAVQALQSGSMFAQSNVSPSQSGTRPEPAQVVRAPVQVPPPAMLVRLRESEFQSVKTTDENSTLSLVDLHQGQLTWRETLKSFHVDFIYSLDRRIDTALDQRNKKAGHLVAADLSYSVSVATKNEKLYETYQDLTPTTAKKPALGKQGKVQARKTKPIVFKWTFNGSETQSHEEYRALGTIQPGRDEKIIQHGVWFFTSVYLPYGPTASSFKKTEVYPPEALSRPNEYLVLPQLDLVDGHLCHVAASDHDVMWIDPKHGFCIRRRAWLVRESVNDPGKVLFIQIARDFVESFPGIWLPKLWYCLQFCDSSAPPALNGQLYSIDKIAVSSLRVNNVADSLFSIDFPPGTSVLDLRDNRQYIVPQGEEMLEKAIAEGRPIIDGKVLPARRQRSSPPDFRRWLWLGNGVVALGILVFLVFLRRRLRPNGNP